MKYIQPKYFSMLFAFFLLPLTLFASASVNTEDHAVGTINMEDLYPSEKAYPHGTKPIMRKANSQSHKDAKMEARLEKLLHRQQAKHGIDNLGDPTDRWFWLGAGSLALGILITIIAGGTIGAVGLGILWLLTFAFGAFSLILWLKKRYGD